MGCMECISDEPFFTNHVIFAWFNFVKTFLYKENCFWEQVGWKKNCAYAHNDVQKIWSKKGAAFLSKNTEPMLKQGGSSMSLQVVLAQGGLDNQLQ